ncbi:response regulator [Sphingomonas sp. LM7]|uniref:response regulator n=1 Tax=Sphingomonas sp. LM7 TaxID=1938607 RepID=UPI000983B536|nr:response regulator [Sphingomonas sp. LM7]AQR73434.1 hybrid sensor histidine kinase/response regulator [Sphingomonas sp. LM7]
MLSLLVALSTGSYAPHGASMAWRSDLLWGNTAADAVLALAYFSISLGLAVLIRRRRDFAFGWMFWCFALFLMAGGFVHLMSILTLWRPFYALELVIKGVTAAASIATAIALWPLVSRVISMPSRTQLAAANAELESLVRERDAALAELRDHIDQRGELEAALLQSQRLEAVGHLTGGVAHDFNNLLQAVAGNLELIARKPDDIDRVVGWSASALNAVERGRSLTSQLLAFSSKQRMDIDSVRLGELVSGVKDLIERAVAPLGQVRIERIDPGLNVEVDSLQLELALLNLAFNARDAMPEGGILTIAVERRSGAIAPDLPAGDYVALTLSDTGVGMSPDVRARAAEPFFTTKGPGKGTGMGLAMASTVVRRSGGSLAIESEEGQGTSITLFLRIATSQPRRIVGDDAKSDVRIDLTGYTIALVDDDAQVRGSLRDTLISAGATVEEAAEGNAGIELVRRVKPDLLVVDFAMPGMTGVNVVHKVREEYPDMPVVLVTGYADSEKLDSLPSPQVVVLWKPFEAQELLRKVAGLLGR